MATKRENTDDPRKEQVPSADPDTWENWNDSSEKIPETLGLPNDISGNLEELQLKKAGDAITFLGQVKSDMRLVADSADTGAFVDDLIASESEVEPPLIGRFELIREIGEGGFAKVFLAHDPILNREIALKVPKPSALMSAESRIRFEREAQTAALLTHPNIATVYEAGSIGPLTYIASEFCPGPNMSQWFEQRGRKTDSLTAAKIVAVLAESVHHAHQRGIIHRDLKLANVLVAPVNDENSSGDSAQIAKQLRITDFGLARQLETGDSLTTAGAIVGTPAYMSPEQARGEADVTASSDIFSLGVILHELLTGKPPFVKSNHLATLRAVEENEVTRVQRPDGKIARDLEAICLTCLQKNPAKRYESAFALAEDLNRFCESRPVRARKPGTVELLWRWVKRNPALAASLAFAFTSLLAGLIVSTSFWQSAEHQKSRAESNVELLHDTIRSSLAEYATMDKEKLKDPQQQKLISKMLATHRALLDQESETDIDREMVDSYMTIYRLYRKLGMFPEALEVCQHSKSLVQRALKQSEKIEAKMQLLEFDIDIQIAATFHAQGRHDETIAPLEELIDRYRRFEETDGQTISAVRWFDAHRMLGNNLHGSTSKEKEAHLHFQLAVSYATEALAQENNSRTRYNYAKSLESLALVTKHPLAKPLYVRALEELKKLDRKTKDRIKYADDIAFVHSEIGRCHFSERNYEQADKFYQRAIKRLDEGLLIQPDNVAIQSRLIHTVRRLATVKQKLKDFDGAREALARGLASVDKIKYEHMRLGLKSAMCIRWNELAIIQKDPFDDRCRELLDETVVTCLAGIEKFPKEWNFRKRIVYAIELRACFLEAEEKFDEGFQLRSEMYRELDEHWKEFDIPEATKMWRRLLRVSLKRMTKAERFEEAKLFLDGRAQAFLDVRVNAGKDEPGVRYDLAKEYMLLANVSRNKETGLDIEDLESLSLGQLEAAASAGFANPKRLSREKVWEPLRNDERFALIKNSLPPKK